MGRSGGNENAGVARFRNVGAVMAVVTLAGCAVGPSYIAPVAQTPPKFVGASQGTTADLAYWWSSFGDPILTDVVSVALSENLDIAQSRARLLEARADLAQSRAALLPRLSSGASATRKDGGAVADSDVYSNSIDASWTIDIFGGARRTTEAARASADAAGYSLESVRIAVAAEVARAYVDLRTLQTRLAIARDTLKSQDENLEIARFRNQAGLASALDVEQARVQRALTAATIPPLASAIARERFRLAVLSGQPPGALDDQLGDGAIPSAPAASDAGLPAELVRRRPDVRAAERNLAAATARIGAAEAQRLPNLSLSGSIASSAASAGALNQSWATTAIGAITQPIFQGGALRAVVRQRRAAAEGALAAYRASVLTALEDVENALAARESASARAAVLQEQVEAAASAAELARFSYRAGLTDFQRLLEAERSLLSARDSLASAQGEVATAAIQLYLALGGGWAPPALTAQGGSHE